MSEEMKNWYVLQTKPFKEFTIEKIFRQARFPVYLPKTRNDNGTPRPLFPRYGFIFFDYPRQFSLVRYTRGVSKILGNSLGPTPIDEKFIMEIRSQEVDGFVQLEEDLGEPQPGDIVEVRRGPFQGLRGIFKKGLDDGTRVQILLNYVNYQGCLWVERSQIKKVK